MTTAIIGTGNIGASVARHLVDGGERIVLGVHDRSKATALADELGELASATSVEKAITEPSGPSGSPPTPRSPRSIP